MEARRSPETATLVQGADAVCDAATLETFAELGIKILALRSAGCNNVDLVATQRLRITVALMLSLNRIIHRAYNRMREGNFALDGLLGFDMRGRSVGIIGTGRIGLAVARIMLRCGCKVLAHDPFPAKGGIATGLEYLGIDELLAQSDIVTLRRPLTPGTRHLIDHAAVARMRRRAMVRNTSRGAIGLLGLDLYEEEADLFFEDLSGQVRQDVIFAQLLIFPKVLTAIAETTIGNITSFAEGGRAVHEVSTEKLA